MVQLCLAQLWPRHAQAQAQVFPRKFPLQRDHRELEPGVRGGGAHEASQQSWGGLPDPNLPTAGGRTATRHSLPEASTTAALTMNLESRPRSRSYLPMARICNQGRGWKTVGAADGGWGVERDAVTPNS